MGLAAGEVNKHLNFVCFLTSREVFKAYLHGWANIDHLECSRWCLKNAI